MDKGSPYEMTLSLNVLNHLGLNLYSNVPAVLAEVVANSWDADAETVVITVDPREERIVIQDDGHGMTREEVNAKYLHVGYQRREHDPPRTPKWNRLPMGRKGIGKLSLFSIAKTITVETVKEGQPSAFLMKLDVIKAKIGEQGGTYCPEPLSTEGIEFDKGTRIVLTDLKKQIPQAASALRKRLARRFSVIGARYHFGIEINGEQVHPEDRDYYHKVQYLWTFSDDDDVYSGYCKNAESVEDVSGKISPDEEIRGWIGTVDDSGSLKDEFGDSLNRIVVLVRGKVAQEDILEEFGETGLFSRYLIGEIHADFLDVDDMDDIATSSRQHLIEDDPRYEEMKGFIRNVIKKIQSAWTDLRIEEGGKKALEIPAIKTWFRDLGKDQKRSAKALFGKINRLPVDDPDEKKRLFKHAVIAFESFRYKENLAALEAVSVESIGEVTEIFADLDDIEATLYHQIIRERIEVIRALQEKVQDNALEKVIQQHVFEHLWLLDASWERATGSEYMEQEVRKEFKNIDARLTDDEKKGRLDIKYRTASGKHIIIELKRAERRVSVYELAEQIAKYRNAMVKLLQASGLGHEPIEFVCILGKDLTQMSQHEGHTLVDNTLRPLNARVIMYKELLHRAHSAYKAFIEQNEKAGRVTRLIEAIDAG